MSRPTQASEGGSWGGAAVSWQLLLQFPLFWVVLPWKKRFPILVCSGQNTSDQLHGDLFAKAVLLCIWIF